MRGRKVPACHTIAAVKILPGILGMLLLCGAVALADSDIGPLKPLEIEEVAPAKIVRIGDGHFFIDFGRDGFGYLLLDLNSPDARDLEVHLGEKRGDGDSVDRKPGGSIRYVKTTLSIQPGRRRYRVNTPPDKKNTSGNAVRLPESIGVVLPFRYAEILNCPVDLDTTMVRRATVHYPFDDFASSFTCSDARLNEVWDLCKYSIKATSFAGIYVDGDRERIPYEADAYINQLGHYGVDHEYALARHTHEYLLTHPTWPTEWKQISVLIAYADWMYTGNLDSLRRNYDLLKREKVLSACARADGLLDTSKLKDIVDWPAGERDGFVMSPVNTVVNAFHYRTLVLMAEMAAALEKVDDAAAFRRDAQRMQDAFKAKLWDAKSGVYVDGEGVAHSSLHANLFALAFGLVPDKHKPRVIDFIKSRGMACSVYPAQFLLEALFENGQADYAIDLMTRDDERSWRHMLAAGSTITTEAWDSKFKPNQDWNHAWGAAPANILPRYVLGVRPLEPGFAKFLIAPQPGPLKKVQGVVPTIKGPVSVTVQDRHLEVDVPPQTTARVQFLARDPIDVGPGRHVFDR